MLCGTRKIENKKKKQREKNKERTKKE